VMLSPTQAILQVLGAAGGIGAVYPYT